MAYTLINTRPVGRPTPEALPTALGAGQGALVDSFKRRVTYLRLSITDRCDLRCTYCMPERMTFLPRKDVLSFEELDELVTAFASFGVDKLRITGGEPLVRKDIMELMARFSRQARMWGPSWGWSSSLRSSRGLLRANRKAARMKKGTLGSSGRTTPTPPSARAKRPSNK